MAAVSASAASATIYTFVGSWLVGDGPVWTSNPSVYSGQDAAAFLFGGAAGDYAISTIDNDPLNIDHLAFLDGWGDTQYLSNPQSESYSLTNGTGYNDPYGGPSYSAYVLDHTCFNRYGNGGAACEGDGTQYRNYAFRADGGAVPEPATWGLMILGFGLSGVALRSRRRMAIAAV